MRGPIAYSVANYSPFFGILAMFTKFSCTVWKFHGFSATQILREINFEDSRSSKSAILTHLEAVNLDLNEFLQLLKAEIDQIKPKIVINSTFRILEIDFT